MTPLARVIEALLFLSPEPVSLADLRDASEQDEWAVLDALTELRDGLHGRGVELREVAGGWALASRPEAEDAARRLLSRPRTPSLTPAQAEELEEQRRGAVEHGAERRAARLLDQPTLGQRGGRRLRGHAADAGDLGP